MLASKWEIERNTLAVIGIRFTLVCVSWVNAGSTYESVLVLALGTALLLVVLALGIKVRALQCQCMVGTGTWQWTVGITRHSGAQVSGLSRARASE